MPIEEIKKAFDVVKEHGKEIREDSKRISKILKGDNNGRSNN